LLNVNVPPHIQGGWRITRQGRRVYRDALVERRDPRGRPYYWIGGEAPSGVSDEGTDFWALEAGHVSITPLHLDLTDYNALSGLAQWFASEL
jgi:5'-nucleotidase